LIGSVFRLLSVFIGLIIAYLVIKIYDKTKGGSDGWVALMITYVSLGLWALFQVIFLWVVPDFGMRVVTGTIFFFVIGIFNPLSAIILSRDMKIDKPKWFNRNSHFAFTCIVLASLVIYNFVLSPFTNPFSEVLTIALTLLGILILISAYGFYILYKGTGLKVWMHMVVAAVIISMGIFFVLSFNDCCGLQSPLEGTEACSAWMYDYADVLPAPCMEGFIPISSGGTLLILIGEIIFLCAFMRILRSMDNH
jgi:hypothetical protein